MTDKKFSITESRLADDSEYHELPTALEAIGFCGNIVKF